MQPVAGLRAAGVHVPVALLERTRELHHGLLECAVMREHGELALTQSVDVLRRHAQRDAGLLGQQRQTRDRGPAHDLDLDRLLQAAIRV